jgi:CRP-like cAMP-binding protein
MNQCETRPVARFIKSLPVTSQNAVMALAEAWSAQPGDCLFRHQAAVSALWMIDQGQVRFQFDTESGRTIVTGLAGAGHCFGDIEIVEDFPAQSDAIALNACSGWRLPRAAVLHAMDQIPGFARLLVISLARGSRLLQQFYRHTLLMPADQRLALVMLNLAQPATDGSGRLVVELTQDALTEYTGTSRQFVSKHISLWVERGWIATHYRSLEILAPEQLRALLDSSTDPLLLALLANR